MSGLPKGWAEVPMSEVASWGSGGTPSRSNSEYYGGTIPWIKTGELGGRFVFDTEEKITELGLKNSSAKLFEKGSVAIAMYGATIGKTSILAIDATTNQACGVGKPIEGVTTSEYLYHYLSSQKEAFIEAGKGGAQPNISQAVIKNWPIPLAPLPEQQRIADKLDTTLARVDACRERLARVAPILKRFRQSVLAAATSGQLTADWREQQGYGHTGNCNKELQGNTNLGQVGEALPDSAKQSDNASGSSDLDAVASQTQVNGFSSQRLKLKELCDISSGFAFKKNQYSESGSKLLQIANVGYGNVLWDDVCFISNELADGEFARFALNSGDFVLALNRPITNGQLKVAQITEADLPSTLYQRVACLKLNKTLLSTYFFICLQGPDFLKQIEANLQGSDQPYINSSAINELTVPFFSLAEQAEIVRRVEALFAFADRLEARLACASAAAERLTPSLLAKAFRGELVPQDPNDEPASELLKRLAAQREAMPKAKRGRKGTA